MILNLQSLGSELPGSLSTGSVFYSCNQSTQKVPKCFFPHSRSLLSSCAFHYPCGPRPLSPEFLLSRCSIP